MEQVGKSYSGSLLAACPGTTITKYCKLGGLKQPRFIFHKSGGQKSKISFFGLKPRGQQVFAPSRGPSQLLELHPRAPGPLSIFKASSCFHHHVPFCFLFQISVGSLSKGCCDCIMAHLDYPG